MGLGGGRADRRRGGRRLRLPPADGAVGGAGMVVAAAPGVAAAFADALSRAGAL